jgi:signal transduction histidine kinase
MPAMGVWQLKPLAVLAFGLTVAAEIATVVLSIGTRPWYGPLPSAVFSVTLAGAGVLIASRRPRNAVGWLFCGLAVVVAIGVDASQAWGTRATVEGWPGTGMADLLLDLAWLPGGLALPVIYLLVPEGRLLSPRWAIVPISAAVGIACTFPAWVVFPAVGGPLGSGSDLPPIPAAIASVLESVGIVLYVAALMAAALSLVLRFRRSAGDERQQVKWFGVAAVLTGAILPFAFLLWRDTELVEVIIPLALLPLPIAATIAILRYRLYDIDLVISRTVVYGVLTIVLGATFAATSILIGAAIGSGSSWTTAGATLAAAVAFRPLRTRVQDIVDRSFSGARYAALRRVEIFLEELRAGRIEPEEIEELVRDIVADPSLRLLYFLPESGIYATSDGSGQDVSGMASRRIPLERAGKPLGMVAHGVADEARLALLRRVVEASGLAIEIARLRVELRRQLAAVDASRRRIAAAAHEERRRIERDLHDGAQQRLVSIGLALRHAEHELDSSTTAEARRSLDAAVAEIALAIGELRSLAKGLPPSQLDAGLAPAFEELARRSPIAVDVRATAERFPRDIEATAYFIGAEAITNAVKHASASQITLRADRRDNLLVLSIGDDGVGGADPVHGSGLTGLADRVQAAGGTLRIESERGGGTRLTAELPCAS